MKKKRLEQELRALAERHAELEEAHRLLATHAEVIALAVRSPDHVPEQDLDDAIAGLDALRERRSNSSRLTRLPGMTPTG